MKEKKYIFSAIFWGDGPLKVNNSRYLLTFGLAFQKLVKEGSTDVVYILDRDRMP